MDSILTKPISDMESAEDRETERVRTWEKTTRVTSRQMVSTQKDSTHSWRRCGNNPSDDVTLSMLLTYTLTKTSNNVIVSNKFYVNSAKDNKWCWIYGTHVWKLSRENLEIIKKSQTKPEASSCTPPSMTQPTVQALSINNINNDSSSIVYAPSPIDSWHTWRHWRE